MPETSRGLATRLYRTVLRRTATHLPADRYEDLLLAFEDGHAAARARGGPLQAAWWTVLELCNLVADAGRRRMGVGFQVTEGRPPRQSHRRLLALWTDARQAVRGLRSRPADAVLTGLLIAAGVSTTGIFFGVADALLLRPAPFPDGARLAQVLSVANNHSTFLALPTDVARRWLSRRDLFSAGGGAMMSSALLTDRGDAQVMPAAFLSPGLLETLGVQPVIGRTFRPEEGLPGTDHLVILSDEIWAARFGRDPTVLGQALTINDEAYQVIGVMPAAFRFPFDAQRLWMPLSLDALPAHMVMLTARLAPGLTRDAFRARLTAIGTSMSVGASRPWPYRPVARFLDEPRLADTTRTSIWLLLAATGLIVALVCLNVANLGLARALSRVRDAAVCSALGASRLRLVRQALLEELFLGVFAVASAYPLTVGGLRLATALLPASFTRLSVHVIAPDARVLVVVSVLAVLTPLVAGLLPAWAGSGPAILDSLRSDNRSVSGTRTARHLRQALVTLQVACAVVLLVSAALLGRSFLRLERADIGLESRGLLSVNLGFPRATFPTAAAQDLYVHRAVDALRHEPGVLGVTPADGVPPIAGLVTFEDVEAEGRADPIRNLALSGYSVRPNFFQVVGLRLERGRAFLDQEDGSHVILGRILAATLWPHEDPIGRHFRLGATGSWYEVVGLVGDVREDLSTPETTPEFYLPLPDHTTDQATVRATNGPVAGQIRLAIRVTDTATTLTTIRRALKAADSSVLILAADRADDEYSITLARPRFLLALMGLFAAAGLLIAAAGVYGVLSYLVAHRMREIGLRLMLGESPRQVRGRVLRSSLGPVMAGLVVGIGVATAAVRAIGSLLFEVDSHDPTSFAVVVIALLLVALAASWQPARRAMRADPLSLLRRD